MSLECGTYLLGIIIGELFHRVALLIEESNHTSARHRKSTKKMLKSVFSNKHSQYVTVPLLLFFAVFLQYLGGHAHLRYLELVARACPVVAVWAALRMFGAFENSLEDMEILEESNAELGPGLAANYWFSFLKPALKADIRGKMEENLRPILNNEMEDEGPQIGANYRNFAKLILPLPDDCHLKIRDERILKEENIFKHTDHCDGTDSCEHNLEFKLEAGEKRPHIKQTVHWIYESAEYEEEADTDEKKEKKKNANKIFIIFDFPQLLQSAMGPDRGWEEHHRPGARLKNINSFKKTLKSLLQCNDYIQYQKDVLFMPFPNRERKEAGEQRKPLSAIFREKILEEELKQEAVYSSSSCSESDLC
jgi:hypothetical protein